MSLLADPQSSLAPPTLTSLLTAAKTGDLESLKLLITSGTHPGEQDPTTGTSPLMLAAGNKQLDTVKYLLEQGAPWNALDKFSKCAGNYAILDTKFNLESQEIVDFLVGHAVKCELILAKVSRERATFPRPSASASECSKNAPGHQDQSNEEYIKSKLRYTEQSLIDGENDGVMMAWETPIMSQHVEKLLGSFELDATITQDTTTTYTIKLLNVGFGMGIVDTFFQQGLEQICQQYKEAGIDITFEHFVIEAHPDVLSRIKSESQSSTGKFSNFKKFSVLEGRWQDILPELTETNQNFDFIYFDTFAEYDDDFHQFIKFLPKILKPNGKFSFFNGNCPDNIFFHGVACEIIKLQLSEVGLKVDFESIDIDAENDPSWEEVRRKYWFRKNYYLPHVYF